MPYSNNVNIPWPGWHVVKKLGSGGFGNVYEIEKNEYGLKETAALKVISIPRDETELDADYTDGYSDEDIRDKYQEQLNHYVQEYKLMKEMQGHSNIVSCEACDVVPHTNGIGWDIFIRMELLKPLTDVLKQRDLDVKEITKLGMDICSALELCEKKNIIHRDIKPENIMVTEYGTYKLGDFGVGRVLDHTTYASKSGTERYMAPELSRWEKYGSNVDIYSLGMVLYFLLNKRRMPFEVTDRLPTAQERAEAQQKRYSGVKLPEPINGNVTLKQTIVKACHFNPKERYQSASDMLKDLQRSLQNGSQSPFISAASSSALDMNAAGNVTEDFQKKDFAGYSSTGNDTMNNTFQNSAAFNKTEGNEWNDTQATIGMHPKKNTDQPSNNDAGKTVGIKYQSNTPKKHNTFSDTISEQETRNETSAPKAESVKGFTGIGMLSLLIPFLGLFSFISETATPQYDRIIILIAVTIAMKLFCAYGNKGWLTTLMHVGAWFLEACFLCFFLFELLNYINPELQNNGFIFFFIIILLPFVLAVVIEEASYKKLKVK